MLRASQFDDRCLDVLGELNRKEPGRGVQVVFVLVDDDGLNIVDLAENLERYDASLAVLE